MELKVDPKKDALLGPAMRRFSLHIHSLLANYVKGPNEKKNHKMLEGKLQNVLAIALGVAVERGYDLAITAGNIKSQRGDIVELRRAATRRSVLAAKYIAKTTKKALDIEAMSKEAAGSKKRSDGITEYEMPKMFFMGMRKGWGRITGNRMPTKTWFVNSDNPCELCQENEDEGPIPIDDAFPSGDYEPGIHINCDCVLGLHI